MNEVTVGLWALLEFAMMPPTNLDFQQRMHYETSLLNDILTVNGIGKYNRLLTPGKGPLEISPILNVEHMETLDERQQIMVLHGTLVVYWHDERLSWNRTLYGGIHSISKTRSFLRVAQMQPYIPRMYITELFSKTADLLNPDAAIVSILYTGAVSVSVKIQIKTTCHFQFEYFPRDKQECSFSFFLPNSINQVTIGGIGFGYRPAMNTPKKAPLSIDMFQCTDTQKKTLYVIPGSVPVEDPQKYPASLVRSIAWFNFVFQRRYKYYHVKMAYPVFCISCCTYLFAAVSRSLHSVTWLMFTLCYQIIMFASVAADLPPDYGNMPKIGVIATLVLTQTAALFLWRLMHSYIEQHYKENQVVLSRLRYVEFSVRVCIPLLILYNFICIFIIV